MEYTPEESGYEKPHIPEGIHHATFVGDAPAPDGQYGPRVALDFVVFFDNDKEPVKMGRVFGAKLTPKSQLWEAFTALGAKLEFGKSFDAKSLLGNPCRVVVEDYKDDNTGKTVSGIQKVKEPNADTTTFIAQHKLNQKDKTAKQATAATTTTKPTTTKANTSNPTDAVPVEEI